MIWFKLAIAPVAKGRPRFARTGRVYTPAETARFERDFALFAQPYKPNPVLSGALSIDLIFTLVKPKRAKRTHPSCRPDLDNYAKAVLDSLKAFWKDDGQIVRLNAEKQYGDAPSIIVCIKEVA